MSAFNLPTKFGVVAAAALFAFFATAYGNQAESHGTGAKDPTAVLSFDRAEVGGRRGCDVESWPYIAPECLQPTEGTVRATRRV